MPVGAVRPRGAGGRGGKGVKTVLFVDDDEGFRTLCKRIFEDEGYRVLLAEDSTEAIDALETESPDIAILDVRMPRTTGLELAEEIRGVNPRIPIIFYTCCDDVCAIDPARDSPSHVSARVLTSRNSPWPSAGSCPAQAPATPSVSDCHASRVWQTSSGLFCKIAGRGVTLS